MAPRLRRKRRYGGAATGEASFSGELLAELPFCPEEHAEHRPARAAAQLRDLFGGVAFDHGEKERLPLVFPQRSERFVQVTRLEVIVRVGRFSARGIRLEPGDSLEGDELNSLLPAIGVDEAVADGCEEIRPIPGDALPSIVVTASWTRSSAWELSCVSDRA
jgi:hypothetical protein